VTQMAAYRRPVRPGGNARRQLTVR
jgi:hypothetical protein